MAEPILTVKYDFNFALAGFLLAGTFACFVVGLMFFDTLGIEREIAEYIGKWGALIEDGYEAQREINAE